MPINYYIFLAVALFCIGVAGVLTRRNAIIIFMCIELMLNSVNLLLVAFSKMHHHAQPTACQTEALACASAATGAFAPDGRFWVTWSAGGRISVASSADLGKTFSTPVTLPATKLPLDDGPA